MIVQQPYRLRQIIPETNNTFVWQLVPITGEIFNYEPGQFALIQHRTKKPYSIASSPANRDYLEFGIKLQGGFTRELNKLTVGAEIGIEGPYGVFIYQPEVHRQSVMFAGGIGITPMISMIRAATDTALDNKITLYYCNQTEDDIAYKKTLDELAVKNPNLRLIYSVDKSLRPGWTGEVGFVTADKIGQHLPDLTDRYFFMCGPLPFMKAVEGILLEKGVPGEMIKKEVF